MTVTYKTIAQKTVQEYGDDNIARLGAALAYYAFTSFFPLLLVLISIIGIALSFNLGAAEDARTFVIDSVASTLPTARQLLAESIQETEQNSWTLGLAGLLTGLWAASNIFAQLEDAFNVIFDVKERERGWKDMAIARGRAALLVVLIAVLMIGSLMFSTFLTTADELVRTLPGGGVMAWGLNLLISLSMTALVFSALFKFIPDKTVTWKAAIIGGVFTSLTWQIGRDILALWLGNSGGVTAGTVVGSTLAFLALIYYASQILLTGAELTATYDELVHPDIVCPETADDSPLCPDEQEEGQEASKLEQNPHVSAPTRALEQAPVLVMSNPPSKGSDLSFGAGFLTGIMAVFIGLPVLLTQLLGESNKQNAKI